jgi:outer membrane protein
MERKQLITFILFIMLYSYAGGQEVLTLDLKSAREHALNYNRTIKSSGLAVDKSQEMLWETIATGLPQINATTDYSNAMGAKISIQFDENMPATEIPIKPTSNFNLQLGQLLFNGSYLVGIQTAKLAQKLSEKNLEKTEQEVVSQVTQSYYLVLVSEESLQILRNNTENLQEIYKKTEPLVKVGMMEKVELDQLSVQVNSLDNAVKSAERQLEMAKNLLRVQLGVTAETELNLTEKLSDFMADQLPDALEFSFTPGQNIDYQLLEVQEDITEKQINMQKTAYLPTISGYYNFTKKILKPAFDMSPAHMFGFQMNIPVFSSGERRSKVRQAKIELVDAGMPVATMIDVGHYQVEVEIPVSLYVDRDAIISFSAVQPDVSDISFPLQLLSYSKKADNNQLYKLRLGLNPASQPKLAPGMDVQVSILCDNDAEPLACVPLSALFNKGGKAYVWVYRSDSTVQKREVVTGKLTGDGRIRIASGVNVDEQVVVAGVNLLNDNEKVEPIEPVSETNVGGLL